MSLGGGGGGGNWGSGGGGGGGGGREWDGGSNWQAMAFATIHGTLHIHSILVHEVRPLEQRSWLKL